MNGIRRTHPVVLGAFRLEEPVAGGGMGQVWRATHVPSAWPVAVKVGATSDAATVAAFRAEVRAMAALSHPTIVRVHDLGRVPDGMPGVPRGSPWFAMEWAEEGTLVARCGQLAWPEVRRVLRELLDALAHAHARGVVHRDVKPTNVLLARGAGGGFEVRLADFGIALLGSAPDGTRGMGTEFYAPPEQRAGAVPGPWTDLYALGRLAQVLVTGSMASTAPRTAIPRSFPEWLDAACAWRPEDRFRRAADALAALEALDRDPLVGSASGTVGPLDPGATVALPDGGTDAPAAPRRPRAPHSGPRPPDAPPPTQRRRPDPVGPGRELGYWLQEVELVGRTAQRERLWRVLCDVAARETSAVVVLRGPTGLGKSRLARWLAHAAHECGAAEVFVGRGGAATDPLAHVAGALAPGADLPPIGEPRWRRLRDALLASAGERIALLWLDDVAAAPESLAFAHSTRGARGRLLVVLTVNDDVLRTRPHELASLGSLGLAPDVVVAEVGRLEDREQAELVRRVLPLDAEATTTVVRTSGGHPQFAMQLVRDWFERGRFVPTPDGLALRGEPTVPPTLEALWEERVRSALAHEPTDRRDALELAACLGSDVSATEWDAARGLAGLLPDAAAVEPLVVHGLAAPQSGDGFAFAHELVRSALLRQAAGGGRLAAWHAACAEALATATGPEAAERRGRHLLAARRPAEAVPLLDEAVVARSREGAWVRAHDLALELEAALRDAGVGRCDPRWATPAVHRACALWRLGRPADAERLLRRALTAGRRHRWSARVVAPLWLQLANVLRSASPARALRVDRRAMRLLSGSGDPSLLCDATFNLAATLSRLGRDEDARPVFLACRRRALRRGDAGWAIATRSACFLAMIDLRRSPSAALRWLRAVSPQPDPASTPTEAGLYFFALGRARDGTGDLAGAERAFLEAERAWVESGSAQKVVATATLAHLDERAGRLDTARARWLRALDEAPRAGRPDIAAGARVALLLLAVRAGDAEHAARALRDVRELPPGQLAHLRDRLAATAALAERGGWRELAEELRASST